MSNVLILSSCKTDSEDISTRLLYLYLEYLRFLETSDILILVHYIVWHSLFVLETGLFQFVKLYDKALLTLTTGNDLFMSLVIHPSDVTHAALVFSLATLDKSILISYFDCTI